MEDLTRARRKLTGEWVYGSLISIGNDWCQTVPTGTAADDVCYSMVRVITDTIGRFTGKIDDMGVKIFEGDVVKDIVGNQLSVEWNDDTLRWQVSNGEPLNDGDNYSAYWIVIGNIHENPHLITK